MLARAEGAAAGRDNCNHSMTLGAYENLAGRQRCAGLEARTTAGLETGATPAAVFSGQIPVRLRELRNLRAEAGFRLRSG